jgi:hypothetical protein
VTLINRHLNPQSTENDKEIRIKILWGTIQSNSSKYDNAFINKIVQENLKTKQIFDKIPSFQITEQPDEDNQPHPNPQAIFIRGNSIKYSIRFANETN